MRDIIIIRGKCIFKTAKGHQFKEKKMKKKERKEGETMENSAREGGAEFGRNNNTPVAISLYSTVGSCWVFDILFFSHYSTNWTERFEGTQSVGQKSSSELFWKTKGNNSAEQFWSPADFSLFHRWIVLILGYVVHLDVTFMLDGGDRKIFLRQGFMHVEQ